MSQTPQAGWEEDNRMSSREDRSWWCHQAEAEPAARDGLLLRESPRQELMENGVP